MKITISNEEKNSFAKDLLKYINESPTAYHAVDNVVNQLKQRGFEELYEGKRWTLTKGGKYFVKRDNSSLVAFEIGKGNIADAGFNIIGTHTDSPNFKIKPNSCIVTSDGYVKLNTEVYGGTILSTWFDRPLSVAGRVMIKNKDSNKIQEHIIDLKKPILMIPNLCMHFQRDVNENCSYNKQTHVLPLLGLSEEGTKKGDYLLNILANNLNVENVDIIDYELFLYEYEKGLLTGVNEEFISASRLDNLSMTFAAMQALLDSDANESSKLFVAFDHEEVGSTTAYGANSTYLSSILDRICKCMGLDEEEFYMALANSFAISADTAHAVHPNYSEKHDPQNRPTLGKGPVIKYSSNQRYVTSASSAAKFISVCNDAGVPYQSFVNRSDVVGGSTIGPAMSSMTSIKTVDIGTPLLAMHSIREFGCLVDNIYTAKAFKSFYNNI